MEIKRIKKNTLAHQVVKVFISFKSDSFFFTKDFYRSISALKNAPFSSQLRVVTVDWKTINAIVLWNSRSFRDNNSQDNKLNDDTQPKAFIIILQSLRGNTFNLIRNALHGFSRGGGVGL
jgi:predicted lactoylglutathione lyase